MVIERMSYIVKFFGKEVPKRLGKMDVNLVYVSSKASYAILYCDTIKGTKYISNELKKVKGFLNVEPSLLYEESKNINTILNTKNITPQQTEDPT